MPASSSSLRVFAPAKINLCLHVGARRPDGFHDLESLVVFADVGDELRLECADNLSLEIDGPFARGLLNDRDNLVVRAAEELARTQGRPLGARIRLTKNLPVASGIGGGSADAAATLRGLAQLWGGAADPETLRSIAERLGSDVPVCLGSTPSWMEGRGERISLLPSFPALWAVLVNPGVAIPTGDVFAALRDRRGTGNQLPPRFVSADSLIEHLSKTTNDLEAPARAIVPAIGEALDAIEKTANVELTRMSGSGATSFGLYRTREAAAAAATALARSQPKWWVVNASFPPFGEN